MPEEITIPVKIPVDDSDIKQAMLDIESVKQLTDGLFLENNGPDDLGVLSYVSPILDNIKTQLVQMQPLFSQMGSGFKTVMSEIKDAAAGIKNQCFFICCRQMRTYLRKRRSNRRDK